MVSPRDVVRQDTARALLHGEFAERRQRNPRYSMRSFAKTVGLSQTQLSLILSGKRAVSLPQAIKIAQILAKDFLTVEKLMGISLLELTNSKKKAAVLNDPSRIPESLPHDEGIANLRRGMILDPSEWPTYRNHVDQLLTKTEEGMLICLAIKVFGEPKKL